jgi:hypothetical protein
MFQVPRRSDTSADAAQVNFELIEPALRGCFPRGESSRAERCRCQTYGPFQGVLLQTRREHPQEANG